jgi:hypothetical protein
LLRSSESSSVQSRWVVEPNTIMSSSTIKETTSREQSRIITVLTYIMYNVQDYSVLYNKLYNVICEDCHFICIMFKIIAFFIISYNMWEDCHFTHRWKRIAWPHHFTESGGLGPWNSSNPVTFYWQLL